MTKKSESRAPSQEPARAMPEGRDEKGFLVRFWGVRGSYPTPGPQTVRYGGNTSCVEIEVGEHTLILDAGSGIIRLGNALLQRADGKPLDISLFITHGHGDHLLGLPFFSPLYEGSTRINFFGPNMAGHNIQQLVTPLMSPPYFPVEMQNLPSHRAFYTLADREQVAWSNGNIQPEVGAEQKRAKVEQVRVIAHMTSSHPLNGAAIYRIEYRGRSVVYATDVEWRDSCDPDFLQFVKGADVLIHDAQYTPDEYEQARQGYGHSTIDMATEVANEARVGQLILFHHEPTYNDEKLDAMQAEARTRFTQTYSAYEGMEICLL